MADYCFKNVFIIKRDLQSPLTNPGYIVNFDSGVDPKMWIYYYRLWIENQQKECSIFDKETNPNFDFKVYDFDSNGVADYYTLDDPRLLEVYDERFNKKYLIFSKDCKKMIYVDDSRDEKGLPYYKEVDLDPSQTIRDIILLEDMNIADPEHIEFKNRIYEECWNSLDFDVQILRKNDLVFFEDDPEKSLILNKIILDLNSPLKNPLLTDNFDSGIAPNIANMRTLPSEVKRIVVPPTVNDTIYNSLIQNLKDTNSQYYYPTYLQDDYNYGGGIYDATDPYTGNFDLDNQVLQDKLNQGQIIPIKTSELPILVLRKDDDSITYYDPDTGNIDNVTFNYNDMAMGVALLEANGINNPTIVVIKEVIHSSYNDKLNPDAKRLANIRDTMEEVQSILIALSTMLAMAQCLRMALALNIKSFDSLIKFLNFAECLFKSYASFLALARTVADVQRLVTALGGNPTRALKLMGLGMALEELEKLSRMFPIESITGMLETIGGQVGATVGEVTRCFMAKMLLNKYLMNGFEDLGGMLKNGDKIEDILDYLNKVKNDFLNNSVLKCLDMYFPSK